ncbi:hypothetical protein ACIRP2_30290 [Streptomyces sp. NPDC101194]|uniref:hypothetical protein n=1 Tax=Streptomyces sp. NPDC101194 TaxID=3366127 RepID=UPI0037FC9F61
MATTAPSNPAGGPREARDRGATGATGAAVRVPYSRIPALVARTGAGPDVRN